MMVLESEWRRRERAREAEVAALKQEYGSLDDRTQQVRMHWAVCACAHMRTRMHIAGVPRPPHRCWPLSLTQQVHAFSHACAHAHACEQQNKTPSQRHAPVIRRSACAPARPRRWRPHVLASAEQRKRRIVAAEEVLLRRRKELEREHAGRMAEAEAAVRRLQVRAWLCHAQRTTWVRV